MTDSAASNEKRRYSRVHFDADVLLTRDGQEWRTKLADISLNGLLTKTPDNWDVVPGERFHLEVIFIDSGALINGDVSIAHIDEDYTGFQMIGIDVDSVAHLRRLIELNIGDPDLLNRELSSLHWA